MIFAPAAEQDLVDTFAFIAQESVVVATEFVADLIRKIEWIAEVDFTGSPRDNIRPGLRGFPYRNRCVYFRSHADCIVILRVVHGAQDLTKQEFNES